MASQFDIVFFGGMGDLTLRKLLPAMYRCEIDGEYTDDCKIILTSHKQLSDEDFESAIKASLANDIQKDPNTDVTWPKFRARLSRCCLDITSGGKGWDCLNDIFSGREAIPRIFYLSIPPRLYEECCENLGMHQLVSAESRIILEKPIGVDLASARHINENVAKYFSEEQIYRIDHYLGKETVQNLLALRFTNMLFADNWNNGSVDHVQISISETVGLEGRAGFYNDVGALRDMVQNHLLQLLCLVAMEPPSVMTSDNLRAEKLKVLKALVPIDTSNFSQKTIRGQYGQGVVSDQIAAAYTEELGKSSDTETFVALKCEISNWRWAGVPFYLRTGKRLKRRAAEIVIEFKALPHAVFPSGFGEVKPNRLTIKLQPDEGIELTLMAKQMHHREMKLKPATLSLDFKDTFQGTVRSAYQRLILDVVDGNSSLFIHRDEVEHAWAWVNPILDCWASADSAPSSYASGSWGPLEAELMIERDGRSWVEPGD